MVVKLIAGYFIIGIIFAILIENLVIWLHGKNSRPSINLLVSVVFLWVVIVPIAIYQAVKEIKKEREGHRKTIRIFEENLKNIKEEMESLKTFVDEQDEN